MMKYKKVFKGRSKKFKKWYSQGEEESRQDYWDTRHIAKKEKGGICDTGHYVSIG